MDNTQMAMSVAVTKEAMDFHASMTELSLMEVLARVQRCSRVLPA